MICFEDGQLLDLRFNDVDPAEGRKIPLPELIGDAFGQQILERLVPDDPLIAVPDLAVRKAHDFALRQIRDAKFLSSVEDRGETLLRVDVLAFAYIEPPLRQFFVQFRDDGRARCSKR